jgi:hypothetical protein
MVTCSTIGYLFPDDDPLLIETFTNNQFNNAVSISKEEHCACCWLGVVNIDSARNEQHTVYHFHLVLRLWIIRTVPVLQLCSVHRNSFTFTLAHIVLNFLNLFLSKYTGRFIMFSVITNIYNKKNKEHTLMELFTAIGKLKKFFWQLETFDVCTTGDKAHIDMIFKFLPHTR